MHRLLLLTPTSLFYPKTSGCRSLSLTIPLRQCRLASQRQSGDNETMTQNGRQLEARLKRVEKELAQIKAALAGKPATRWYREIAGVFAGDDAFAEITRLGRLIRQGKLKG